MELRKRTFLNLKNTLYLLDQRMSYRFIQEHMYKKLYTSIKNYIRV